MNAAPENVATGWEAELRLHFGNGGSPPFPAKGVSPVDTRTRILHRSHRGPLVIQRPFYPEGDPCHVYIVHPPGGVVGGDALRIDVQVDSGAHALLTTPAATKFYRCASRGSSQTQELRVTDASLEWLPQENIFYRGAEVRAATRIRLGPASRFIGWEIACLGLPARAEPFDAGTLSLDLELWKSREHSSRGPDPFCWETGAAPVYIDRLRLEGRSAARGARWGLAGCEALGTLLATPAKAPQVDAVRELLLDHPRACASLVDGVLVLRVLDAQAEAIRNLFIRAWRLLRPEVIGRAAVPPRIWNT